MVLYEVSKVLKKLNVKERTQAVYELIRLGGVPIKIMRQSFPLKEAIL